MRMPAALLFPLLVVAAGCLDQRPASDAEGGSASSASFTVTDLASRSVSFKQPVERIVLIRGRDIYALGLLLGDEIEDRLIAWGPDFELYDNDSYRKFVEFHPRLADVPKLGSVYQDAVSVEKVLSLAPDLVVVDTFMVDRGYNCVDRLEQAGLPVLFLDFSTDPFRNPQKSIKALGQVLGKEDRANEIANFINAEIDKVFSRLDSIGEPAPSLYVEGGYQGVTTYGPTYGYGYDDEGRMTSWGAVMESLKARNVAGGVVPNMGPINPEYLLQSDPDVIVITGACWSNQPDAMHLGYYTDPGEARVRLEAFTTRPGWKELTAVKEGRVYGLFHNFSIQTTEFAGTQQLAKWLYPEAFADLDPEARLREFHERFMPVGFSGTWMIGLEETEE